MIGKHVDLIAIGLLLGAAALYAGARNLALSEVIPNERIALSQAVQRVMKCPRAARVARAPRVRWTLVVPNRPEAVSVTTD